MLLMAMVLVALVMMFVALVVVMAVVFVMLVLFVAVAVLVCMIVCHGCIVFCCKGTAGFLQPGCKFASVKWKWLIHSDLSNVNAACCRI